ncbi:MAG: LysM peptidoglycan-binding domain-containing protein [Hahellaceae bacterium]|nr:LysM peptidoglycan-binding domain-containing protein [Hahellaceae bacterium]
MRKLLFALCALFMLQIQFAWGQAELRSGHPDRYTVVKGDTLWDISSRFLQSPWLWPEIWHANPQIDNPHLIYPGDVIGLVYIGGQPRITTLKRGQNSGVVKLSPQARITPISSAIPAIPMDAIAGFLTETRIVEKSDLDAAPYVLSGREHHLVTGAGDVIYARGESAGVNSMGIYRQHESYVDPDTNEFLGLEAKSIAQAKLKEIKGEILTLAIQRSNEEVLQGDRLLPTDDREINSIFHPSAPDAEINGKMIAVHNGVSQIGQYAVVTVNKGLRDGLREGNVLAIYKNGGQVKDPITKEIIALPSERAGLLMVFRAYDKVSYALILKALRPLAILDEVRNP